MVNQRVVVVGAGDEPGSPRDRARRLLPFRPTRAHQGIFSLLVGILDGAHRWFFSVPFDGLAVAALRSGGHSVVGSIVDGRELCCTTNSSTSLSSSQPAKWSVRSDGVHRGRSP